MTHLNKAEIFALEVAQRELQDAEARASDQRKRFQELVSSTGLDPARNYSLAPDGTVTLLDPPALPVGRGSAEPRPVVIGEPLPGGIEPD